MYQHPNYAGVAAQSQMTTAAAPQTVIERVASLEERLIGMMKQLNWAHERISFLESGLGTAATPAPSAGGNAAVYSQSSLP